MRNAYCDEKCKIRIFWNLINCSGCNHKFFTTQESISQDIRLCKNRHLVCAKCYPMRCAVDKTRKPENLNAIVGKIVWCIQ